MIFGPFFRPTLHHAGGPRVVMFLLVLVSIFLLSFIMTGCVHPSGAFKSVYVLEYSYNKSSPFYPYIEGQKNTSDIALSPAEPTIAEVKVRVGLMGVCTILGTDTTCTSMEVSKLNISQLHPIPDFVIYADNSGTELGKINLLDLALKFNTKRPYGIMMGTLISLGLCLALFLFNLMSPTETGDIRNMATYFFLGLGFVFILVCDLVMFSTSTTAKIQAQAGSFGLVAVSICRKTACMYWFSFAFIFIACCASYPMHLRHREEVNFEKEFVAEHRS